MKSLLICGVIALTVSGCTAKTSARTSPAVAAPPASTAAIPVSVADNDFAPKKGVADNAAESLPANVQEINRRGYLKDAFFDFDRYQIRADQRDSLSRDADWLKKWQSVRIRIEGHCDERGTAQYNLALGQERAEAAREYLGSLGIEQSRVEIVSYGKERPFATGHDESAWAENRRDHFVVTSR